MPERMWAVAVGGCASSAIRGSAPRDCRSPRRVAVSFAMVRPPVERFVPDSNADSLKRCPRLNQYNWRTRGRAGVARPGGDPCTCTASTVRRARLGNPGRPLDAAHRPRVLAGVDHFNALDRGLPGISRALLVERLRRLEGMGVVARHSSSAGRAVENSLTPAGRQLQVIIDALGKWGARWAFGDPRRASSTPSSSCGG